MTLIGIGIIILATVWSVHFVYQKAHKHGYDAGVYVGRDEVLKENVIRAGILIDSFDYNLRRTSKMLTQPQPNNTKYEQQTEV